jgi:gamma-glutamyl-gamma-aminobutyrate hydrolase PuuD
MPRRPIIGITSRKVPFFDHDKPYPRYGVAIAYCEAVEAAGGTPIILPLTQERSVLDATFQLLDGLLVPGGLDVHPRHYGEEPHRKLGGVDPLRDLTELHLVGRALREDMPVLGVCRGHQVLNVAAGGTLFQDIHAQVGESCLRHFQDTAEEWPSHSIEIHAGTRLRDLVGEERVWINSYHHQAVKDLAPSFRVSATAPDGVVEAIESTAHTYVLGVQWHPELLLGNLDFNLALFRSHVEAAGRFRAARAPS